MPPSNTTKPQQDLYWALYSADGGLGFCLLTFPVFTFCGALLLGLAGSIPAMHPSDAPFWIILGVCVLFSGWAVLSVRSARRGFVKLGMPPPAIRLRVASVWVITASLMILIGICSLGYLAITFDPDQRKPTTIFGPVDRPLPLTIALTLYALAGVLLLERSRREKRDAENPPELQTAGGQEAGRATAWSRELELYAARRRGEGVLVFVFATMFMAIMIGLGNKSDGRLETSRLLILGLLALGSWLSVLLVRRSRRHLEAAGFSQEEVQREMASTWRTGAVLMIVIGAFGIGGLILAFDLLTPADRPWSLGSSLVYTSTGLLLLWRNRQKRDP